MKTYGHNDEIIKLRYTDKKAHSTNIDEQCVKILHILIHLCVLSYETKIYSLYSLIYFKTKI